MYRIAKIDELFGVVNWRQNHDTEAFRIDSDLVTTRSGLYFEDFHPLITLRNLKNIAPKFDKITYPAWVMGSTYETSDRVTYNNKTYVALQDSTGEDPETETDYWKAFDPFSEWLRNKTKGSIRNAIKDLYSKKIAEKTGRSLLETKPLFEGAGRLADTIDNTSNFVGFELVPIKGFGVTLKIDKLGFQFTGTASAITIYFFHSSNEEAYITRTFTRTKENSIEWFTPSEPIYLPYLSDSTDSGGSWYCGYDQDALAVGQKAINKNKDWSKQLCSTCNDREAVSSRLLSEYLEVHPIKVSNSTLPNLWDVQDIIYPSSTNFGLNLQVSVHCDPSDVLVRQENTLVDLIGLQVAIDMLRLLAYNPDQKVNKTTHGLSRNELLYEIEGDRRATKSTGGLAEKLGYAQKAIDFDLEAMDSVCFRCRTKGVRFRTV